MPSSLARQVFEFGRRLESIKRAVALSNGMLWYPFHTLAALEQFDGFPGDGAHKLRAMIGGDPVLDLGCGDGDAAFFLESLGYRVDAVDFGPTNCNRMAGVQTMKQHLRSGIGIHSVDLDTRPHLPAANYGLALMLGILYHLKNPFLVLETLARQSRYLFLSTRIASLSPDKRVNFGALPAAYLVDDEELDHDRTNFWVFSGEGLKRLVRRAGWELREYATTGNAATADPVSKHHDARAFLLAESRLAARIHLESGWHQLEDESWRWTERRFSVLLEVAATLAPATVRLRFHLPMLLLEQRRAVTLEARWNESALPRVTYSTPGRHEYTATIPRLEPGAVRVEFELDTVLEPSGLDQRELGVQVDFRGGPPVGFS